jgi:phosphatidylcholine synthase
VAWAAWAVHLLTASGALLGFLTITATAAGEYRHAFLWMAVATAVDSADGVLARAARVKDRLPTFNGARLDDIVDYVTFVFAPAYLVYHARLAPEGVALVVVTAMLLSSAYGFSQEAAKTSDYYFTGFPSYWNIVVFYLVVLAAPPFVNVAVLIGLAVLVFVPIAYVYPSRTPTLRAPTVGLGVAWAVLVLVMIWQYPDVSRPVFYLSLVFPVYYVVLSLTLDARRRRGGARSQPVA